MKETSDSLCREHGLSIVEKPKGRGKKMAYSEVKEEALKHDIPVYQPIKLKDDRELIEKLKSLGVNMKYLGKNMGVNDFISGKKFVITGTIDGYGRKEIKEIIESCNGSVSESVSKNTDIVIVGSNPGSKYQDALKLNIMIWDNDKTVEVLNNLPKA